MPICVNSAWLTPSSSAISCSFRHVIVVHTEPSPRARRASMKLQMAGTTDPQNPGCDPSGSSSMRPSW